MYKSLYYAVIYQSYFPTIKLQQSKNLVLCWTDSILLTTVVEESTHVIQKNKVYQLHAMRNQVPFLRLLFKEKFNLPHS
jgi:hypothetical protein